MTICYNLWGLHAFLFGSLSADGNDEKENIISQTLVYHTGAEPSEATHHYYYTPGPTGLL